jgi:hypothetical protein
MGEGRRRPGIPGAAQACFLKTEALPTQGTLSYGPRGFSRHGPCVTGVSPSRQ